MPVIRTNLEKDPAVVYMLDSDLRIRYCNEAWDRFAIENGGHGLERQHQLGRPVMDVIPAPLKRFYQQGYDQVLSSGQPWEQDYDCSSPAVYRRFRMAVYPDPEGDGLSVVNSLAVDRPHGAEIVPRGVNEFVYLDEHGHVTMCCHCRRTCRANHPHVWGWVPANLEGPPGSVSHGLCAVCANLIYSLSGLQ